MVKTNQRGAGASTTSNNVLSRLKRRPDCVHLLRKAAVEAIEPRILLSSYQIASIATFTGNSGTLLGNAPQSALTLDTSGNLFGTTTAGGTNFGTIFEIPKGSTSVTSLAHFTSTSGTLPGSGPLASLTLDSSGNLFGTTDLGGVGGGGTLFEIPAGSTSATSVQTFSGAATGQHPVAALTLDSSGNLFGTASQSGNNGGGTVFEIPSGSTTLTSIANFGIAPSGADPITAMTLDTSGNLFGTTEGNGSNGGSVYTIPKGSITVTTIATFTGNTGALVGSGPVTSLTLDSSGNLFGTTEYGGISGEGTVYEIAKGSNSVTSVANFTGQSGALLGYFPQAALTLDSSGNLFGTTLHGGTANDGTVFELANGSTSVTSIASFTGTSGSLLGSGPLAALTLDPNGNLFGTTQSGGTVGDGTIFEIAKGSNSVTSLGSFTGNSGALPGLDPMAAITLNSSGNLFGTTNQGGTANDGTVFEISPQVTQWKNPVSGNWSNPANWTNGVPTSSSDATIAVAGTYTVTLDESAEVNSLALGGTSGTETLNDTNYTLTLDNASSIGANGALSLSAGSPSLATVAGAGMLTNSGLLSLQSGTINCPLTNAATLDANSATGAGYIYGALTTTASSVINDSGLVYVGASFTNNGAVNVMDNQATGAGAGFVTIGTLTNALGAMITTSDSGSGTSAVAVTIQGGLANAGTVNFTAAKGTNFYSQGYGISNTGSISNSPNSFYSHFFASAATDTFVNAGSLNGGLAYHIGTFEENTGGSISNPSINVAFNFTSCTLDLNAGLTTANGSLQLNGGIMVNGPGTLTVTPYTSSHALLLYGTNLFNAPVESDGFIDASGNQTFDGGLTTATTSDIYVGANNIGSTIVTFGTNVTNNGRIELQNESSLGYSVTLAGVSGGTLTNTVTGTIGSDAVPSGPNYINTNISNAGLIDTTDPFTSIFSVNGLSITGNLTESSTATLKIGLYAATTVDALTVTGSAALAGNLGLALANGFSPTNNEQFTVANYASYTGGMTLVNPPGNTFISQYNATYLVLTDQLLQPTTTVVTSSSNPSTNGSSVTFTATITPASGSGETGTVQFMDGSNTLGSPQPVSGGVATYTTEALIGGSHSIIAVYSGDSNFAGNTSLVLTQNVGLIPVTPTLASNNNPSTYGQSVTFTASVPYAGSLDTSFGTGGIVVTPQAKSGILYGEAIQPDGKIVVVGSATASGYTSTSFAVARYNANGTLDTTFGNGGIVITPIAASGTNEQAVAVAIQPDGKIVVAGSHDFPSTPAPLEVVRYSANGTLDPTFGTGGIFTMAISPGSSIVVHSLALQPDGKILVGASYLDGMAIYRLTSSGTLDTSFNGTGYNQTTFGVGGEIDSIIVLPNGSILGGGTDQAQPASMPVSLATLVRFTSSGALDTTFNGIGYVNIPYALGSGYSRINCMDLLPSGQILFSGVHGTTAFVGRCNADGTLDTTFGTNGVTTISADDAVSAMAVQPNGNIILAGQSISPYNAAVTFLTPNGMPNSSFGTGGQVTFKIGPSYSNFYAVQIQNDSRIDLAGWSVDPTNAANDDFTLARLISITPTGSFQFMDGSTALGNPVTLSGNPGTSVAYATSTLAIGSHPITAVYSGDSNFAGSTSSTLNQAVSPTATSVAVTSNHNPAANGQPVTLTATITPASGSGETGTVQFMDGITLLGSPVAVSAGLATYTTAALPGGSNSITAVYSGDSNFNGSTSPALTQNVQIGTTTAVTSTNLSPTYGQSVTFTATITPAIGSGETGTVQFMDGTTALGGPVAVSGGAAQYTIGILTGGSHSITAAYSGDANFVGSTSPAFSQSVNQSSSSTVVGTSNGSTTYGQSVTFTATVTPPAAGALDSTFGTNGIVVTSQSTSNYLQSEAIQSNGKIIVVGAATAAGRSSTSIAIARYNTNGTLDTTFGTNGITITPISANGTSDQARGVSIQPNGDIVVVGQDTTGNTPEPLEVVRYTANGSPDSTFGTGGIVDTVLSNANNFQADSVALTSFGQIVIGGTSSNVFVVVRLTAAGALDTSFASTGYLTFTPGRGGDIYAMALASNGDIMAAGTSTPTGSSTLDVTLAAITPAGALDTTFNGTGYVEMPVGTTYSGATSLAIQPDGKFVMGDYHGASIGVVRLNTDGSFDTTFGAGGIVNLTGNSAFGLSLQTDGKILVSGDGASSEAFVTRLNTNGTPDASFGTSGTVLEKIGSGISEFQAVQEQSDGRIVAAGLSDDPSNPSHYDFTLARFTGIAPTGTVQFMDGNTSLGSPVPLSSGVATYSTSALTAGSHTITAVYSGDSNFSTSTSNTITQSVGQLTPTINTLSPVNLTYGTALANSQIASDSASVPGTFTYTSAAGSVPSAGNGQTDSVTFTPSDTTDYKSVTTNVTVNVAKATPIVVGVNPVNITYGTLTANPQLSGTAQWVVNGSTVSVAGAFTYISSGNLLIAGNGQSQSVTFTPADTVDYTNASSSVTVIVAKGTPTGLSVNPVNITYGTLLANGQLSGSAHYVVAGQPITVIGTVTYTSAAGTLLGAGNGQSENITFTPGDTLDLMSIPGTVTVNVAQATPTNLVVGPVNLTYGTALANSQLAGGTAGVPGTFAYAAAGTVLGAGNGQNQAVTFTPTDAIDYSSVAGSVTVNVAKATPIVMGVNPVNLTFGTLLDNSQLSGSAQFTVGGSVVAVAGAFSYVNDGTLLTAGNGQSQGVTFTPADTADYVNASSSVTVNVAKATPTGLNVGPVNISYGNLLANAQLSGTAHATVAGLPIIVFGTVAYTSAAGTLPGAGNGQSENVTFTPDDTLDFNNITGTVTVNVSQALTSIQNVGPVNITYGTALDNSQLSGGTASVPGTFTYTSAAGTVLGAGNGQIENVTFTPTDAADYAGASGSVTVNVAQATPVIGSVAPVNITYATPLANSQLSGTATYVVDGSVVNVQGTYTYTSAAGTVLSPGNGQTEAVTFTPADTVDYTVASSTVVVNVAQDTVVGISVGWGGRTAPLFTAADGLRLLPAGRNTDLPWQSINKFTITLNTPANLTAADVSVTGMNIANYGPVTVSGSGTTYTINLGRTIWVADRVTITIGNAGIATYTRRIDVLPGDVNDDGKVNALDEVLERNAMRGINGATPTVFTDISGDDPQTMADYTIIAQRIGTQMPMATVVTRSKPVGPVG